MASFTAQEHVVNALKDRGVNISAVCRAALEESVKLGNVQRSRPKQFNFKAPSELLDRASTKGVNISDVCSRALEALHAELVAGGAPKSRR
jgi:post-segregation antitoxin (ccd killing protein)